MARNPYMHPASLAILTIAWGSIVGNAIRLQRELDRAARSAAVQAEIATRVQTAHLDLELARVGMRVARGELTPGQGAELRDALRREYARGVK